MRDDVNEKLAHSLTADTAELIPYLPYLLQDLHCLGSSPEDMRRLIAEHIPLTPEATLLDLGCGKGSVSLHLAATLGLRVKGIDLMAAFIEEARAEATKRGLAPLCTFEVGDLHEAVRRERGYSILVYGAVGNVLGTPAQTLAALAPVLAPGGHLLLDDGYIEEAGVALQYDQSEYPTLAQWRQAIAGAGFHLIEARPGSEEEAGAFGDDLANIVRRADELTARHPDQAEFFARYVRAQRAEYEDLATNVVGATFLMQKRA